MHEHLCARICDVGALVGGEVKRTVNTEPTWSTGKEVIPIFNDFVLSFYKLFLYHSMFIHPV